MRRSSCRGSVPVGVVILVVAGTYHWRWVSSGTAGVEGVGAVVGLGEVPPGVVEFGFFLPVFEAVGFDEGEEVDAELGFAAAGEFEGGDGGFS